MVVEENWSISPERVRQFLLSQPDVIAINAGFQYRACWILLTPVEGTLMGKWKQPRTMVRLEGEESDVKQMQRRIFLQFLSAGG